MQINLCVSRYFSSHRYFFFRYWYFKILLLVCPTWTCVLFYYYFVFDNDVTFQPSVSDMYNLYHWIPTRKLRWSSADIMCGRPLDLCPVQLKISTVISLLLSCCHLRQVPSWCCVQKIIKIGQCFTQLHCIQKIKTACFLRHGVYTLWGIKTKIISIVT